MSSLVPEGWSKNTINECCEILDSQRVPVNSEERAKRKGDYPYYGANGVQGYIDDYIFEGDAILLAEDGGNFDQYADRPIAQWVTGKFWVNNHAHILRAKDNATDKWIFYSLVHKNILKNINGGTRAKLNQSDLKEIEILLSPLPEQKKIVSILTSMDEVIENTQKQIDKLQDLKKATMSELLTKGIGHTEFKDSELGRIPKSWGISNIGKLTQFVTSGSRGWSQYYSSEGSLFIRIGNLTRDHINLKFADIQLVEPPSGGEGTRTKVKVGDILVSITADLGVIGVVNESLREAYVNQHVCLVRLESVSDVNPRWVGHFLSGHAGQEQFEKKNDGGAKAGLNLPTIRSIVVPLPSPQEQNKVVRVLDRLDSEISIKQTKLAKHQSLKKSLMQDLLTGKVRVTVN